MPDRDETLVEVEVPITRYYYATGDEEHVIEVPPGSQKVPKWVADKWKYPQKASMEDKAPPLETEEEPPTNEPPTEPKAPSIPKKK